MLVSQFYKTKWSGKRNAFKLTLANDMEMRVGYPVRRRSQRDPPMAIERLCPRRHRRIKPRSRLKIYCQCQLSAAL
jgi:hypothetical protein